MDKQAYRYMRDIRAKAYKIFDEDNEDKAVRKEGALKYLEHLGVVTNTDISDWPVLEILEGPKGGMLVDRPAINRKFFAWLEEKPQEKKDLTMPQEVAKIIAQRVRDMSEVPVADIKKNLQYAEDMIKCHHRDLMQHSKNAAKHRQALWDREGKGIAEEKYATAIQKLIDEGKYQIPTINQPPNGAITLITTPIIKTYLNKKQGTNNTVPLGQFKVTYGYNTGLTVAGYKDNVKVGEYIHPHLQGYGLCMGAHGVHFGNAQAAGDVYKIFDVIWEILAQFEERDGYTPLFRFEEQYQKDVAAKKLMASPGGDAQINPNPPPKGAWYDANPEVPDEDNQDEQDHEVIPADEPDEAETDEGYF